MHRGTSEDLPVSALSDEALMLVLTGEHDHERVDLLFAEVVRRYQDRIRAWCVRLVGPRTEVTDYCQEILIKAYCHIHTYRGDSRFSTWLYAITRNHCLNSRKQRRGEWIAISDTLAARMADAGAMEPYRAVENADFFHKVWAIVAATLNRTEARVVALHYGHEVPLGAITRQLSLTNSSGAKAYIVSARRKLDRVLGPRHSRGSVGAWKVPAA